jgi:hypothetical protein
VPIACNAEKDRLVQGIEVMRFLSIPFVEQILRNLCCAIRIVREALKDVYGKHA